MLLVGCPAAVVEACREAGQRLSVAVLAVAAVCELSAQGADGQRAFALVVSEELYRTDPGAFDALARQASSSLLRLESCDTDRDSAPHHIAEAVLGAASELQADGSAGDTGVI